MQLYAVFHRIPSCLVLILHVVVIQGLTNVAHAGLEGTYVSKAGWSQPLSNPLASVRLASQA